MGTIFQVTVGVDPQTISVSESGGTVQVCVELQSGAISGRTFVVGYTTTSGTACELIHTVTSKHSIPAMHAHIR